MQVYCTHMRGKLVCVFLQLLRRFITVLLYMNTRIIRTLSYVLQLTKSPANFITITETLRSIIAKLNLKE